MSSYNKVEKFEYTKNQEDPVALKEYAIFRDEKGNRCSILLKFQNNLNQSVHRIQYEICEYNVDGFMLAKQVVDLGDIHGDAQATFIPKKRLVCNGETTSISFRLIHADFFQVCWEKGEFGVIPYHRYEFLEDYPVSGVTPEPKMSAHDVKVAKKAQKKNQKSYHVYRKDLSKRERKVLRKKNGLVRNIYHFNRPKASLFWGIFFTAIIFLWYLVWSIATGVSTGDIVFFEDDISFMPISETEAEVTGYIGISKYVTIPSHVGDYRITRIDDHAFENTKIKSLTIDSVEIEIGDAAFKGTNLSKIKNADRIVSVGREAFLGTLLTDVELKNTTAVAEDAFKDCSNLSTVTAPKATLARHCLVNTPALQSLSFLDSQTTSFYEIFAYSPYTMSQNLEYLSCGKSYISNVYFNGSCTVSELELPNHPVVEYPAFKELNLKNYTYNGYVEMMNGEIVSQASDSILYLSSPEDVKAYERKDLSKYSTLVITNDSVVISNSFLKKMKNIRNFHVASAWSLERKDGLFESVTLRELSVPCMNYSAYFDSVTLERINVLTILTNGTLSESSLSNFKNVYSLECKYATLEKNALAPLVNLKYITYMPTGISLDDLGLSKDIVELHMTSSHSISFSNSYCTGYQKLKVLELPENTKKVESDFISDCPSLTSIVFPMDAIVSEGAIGTGCSSLSRVELGNLDCDYSSFNKSAEYTKELVINGSVQGTALLNNLEQLEALTIRGSYYEQSFKGCYFDSLRYFSIATLDTYLNYLLGNVELDTLVITTSLIDGSYLANQRVTHVYFDHCALVDLSFANNFHSIKLVYFDHVLKYSNTQTFINQYQGAGVFAYIEGDLPEFSKACKGILSAKDREAFQLIVALATYYI